MRELSYVPPGKHTATEHVEASPVVGKRTLVERDDAVAARAMDRPSGPVWDEIMLQIGGGISGGADAAFPTTGPTGARSVPPSSPEEPLDKLKATVRVAGNVPPRSPRARLEVTRFLAMMQDAPLRLPIGIRTPISPADGLTTIVTAFVIRCCEVLRPSATAAQQSLLDRIASEHVRLVETPRAQGGHRRVGMSGREVDGLSGPTRSHGRDTDVIAVNQTAVAVASLVRLRQNASYAAMHGRIDRLLQTLVPEFQASIAICYPGRDASRWRYGSSTRLEDQSHLKTTYETLRWLANSILPQRAWCAEQAARIAGASPHVRADWRHQSDRAGSIR